MRFKNYSKDIIRVPFQVWRPPVAAGRLTLSIQIEPEGVTQEFDENDPTVLLLLKAHPELRPVVMATAWQRVLDGVL